VTRTPVPCFPSPDKSASRNVACDPGQLPRIPFLRWEKAGLQRDAIRSQWSTRSKRNEKETGL
jgi:hypothetical protein